MDSDEKKKLELYNQALKKCDEFFQETDEQKAMFQRMEDWCTINRKYRPTYRPDERNTIDKVLVKDIIRVFGAKYITIAMISGSIGYHSYRSAELTMKALAEDTCYTCERNGAVFQGDLVREIIHDLLRIRREKDLPNDSWSKPQLVKLYHNVDKMKDWNAMQQMAFSCLYPTGI